MHTLQNINSQRKQNWSWLQMLSFVLHKCLVKFSFLFIALVSSKKKLWKSSLTFSRTSNYIKPNCVAFFFWSIWFIKEFSTRRQTILFTKNLKRRKTNSFFCQLRVHVRKWKAQWSVWYENLARGKVHLLKEASKKHVILWKT